ncbi:nuclear transport factor 2 family protein [Rhizobium sp. CC-YZS058]|uniref:nuclear transport factor 2 family protein n=1 Tax=Rhizobium sp. CC-YZS058 TaxID=3042153 RepID=UPI002B053215|nr:nuclear transport factor 2 family protein [Rhizobium sp. CC-YZS058]MEA3534581.1 nuclear transport factor 2 family protein [Rhizobium sp. CC-YZS058]
MSDEAQIRDVVHRLVHALGTGDAPALVACFHPQAVIIATDGTAVQCMSVTDYAGALPSTDAAETPPGSPDLTIYDITESVAVVKLIDKFDGRSFVGHLSLIRLGGLWQIASVNYQLRS